MRAWLGGMGLILLACGIDVASPGTALGLGLMVAGGVCLLVALAWPEREP